MKAVRAMKARTIGEQRLELTAEEVRGEAERAGTAVEDGHNVVGNHVSVGLEESRRLVGHVARIVPDAESSAAALGLEEPAGRLKWWNQGRSLVVHYLLDAEHGGAQYEQQRLTGLQQHERERPLLLPI